MKLNQTDNRVTSDLSGERKEFGFENPAMVFSALTSYIYKNPAFSVIAELSANAWDSHIQANKTNVPFEVHLPSYYEPYFSIRDKGISMSHDFMLNGYTKAFLSTKNKDDKLSGAWGIGRLTALALSETYTCSCFQDGIKRDYLIFKNNGLPEINFIGEFKTIDENGFYVRVDVGHDKIESFKTNAAQIYKFYPLEPIIKGSIISIVKPDYLIKENDWGILKNGRNNDSAILMGTYGYPISSNDLGQLSSIEHCFLQKGVHFFVNLGEISINLSRDALFYDKKTISKIKYCLGDLISGYEKIAKDDLNQCKSKIKAFKKAAEINKSFKDTYSGQTLLNLDWRGIRFGPKLELSFKKDLVECHIAYKKYSRYRNSNVPKIELFYLEQGIDNFDFRFFYDDLGKNNIIKNRLSGYFKTNYDVIPYIFKFKKEEDFQDFKINNDLEDDDFIAISSLPEVELPKEEAEFERVKNDKHSPKNSFFYLTPIDNDDKASDNWSIIDIDEVDELYEKVIPFVVIDRFKIEKFDLNCHYTKLKLFDPDAKIVGIKSKYFTEKGSEFPPTWLTLENYIKAAIKDFKVDEDLYKKLFFKRRSASYSNIAQVIMRPDIELSNISKERWTEIQSAKCEKTDFFISHDGNHKKWEEEVQNILIAANQEIQDKYPMLSQLNQYNYNLKESIARYIELENFFHKNGGKPQKNG